MRRLNFNPNWVRVSILVLCLLPFVQNLLGEEKKPTEVAKVIWENDVFLLSDREYTNGVRLEYGVYGNTLFPTNLVFSGLAKLLPILPSRTSEYHSLSAMHTLYTPTNIFTSDTAFGERPYSAQGLVSSLSTIFWTRTAFTWELLVGEMGPAVQGKYFQNRIHYLTNSPLSQGWDSQIPNQNLVQSNLDFKYFPTQKVGFQTTAKLGNLDTSFFIAPIFRFGRVNSPVSGGFSLQDPSPPPLIESSEFYFFIRPGIKMQTFNATLGNTRQNPFSGLVETDQQTGVLFQEGRPIFIGEPLYNTLVGEGSGSAVPRFLLYQSLVSRDTPYGMEILVFNSIFNGAPVPDRGLRLSILQSLISSNTTSAEYPYLEYFLYETLFRDRAEGISLGAKFLAYQYFYNSTVPNQQSNLVILALLFNEENQNQSYRVETRRWQGKLSTGVVFQNQDYFVQGGIEVSSLEYKSELGLLPVFYYTSLQCGKKF